MEDDSMPELDARDNTAHCASPPIFALLAHLVGTACAISLVFACFGAVAGLGLVIDSAQASTSPQQSYEGMITDTQCGAKHRASIAKNAADCVRVCVHGGAAFALIDGDNTYTLKGDLQEFKRVAGQRAHIYGSIDGNTITVSSVTAE